MQQMNDIWLVLLISGLMSVAFWAGRFTARARLISVQDPSDKPADTLAHCPVCQSAAIVVESATCQHCGTAWDYAESPGVCPFCGRSDYLFDPAYCPDCETDWRPDQPRQYCLYCSGHGVNWKGRRCEYCGGTGYKIVEPEGSVAWSSH